ncbi:MAG: zinc-dependent alcohol dehydrogenase family protein [Planctomycetaceae bacterium]
MRAVVFEKFGNPSEVLQVKEIPEPKPGPGEVLVRMHASPINPSDLLTVHGMYGRLPKLPAVPGFEGVGTVEAAGPGLYGKYLVGKRVAVLNGVTGNWCDKTVVTARQAVPLGRDLPLEQAAMFFVNPATAYLMTREVLEVPKGEWLLQTAANSAVGHMVIRLGREFGFRTINVVRRAEQVDQLKELGGDQAIHFDPREHPPEKLRDQVKGIVGERASLKYAIDAVGGATGTAAFNAVGNHGRMLVYGALSDEPIEASPRTLVTHSSTVEGFWLARWMMEAGVLEKLKLVKRISKLMRAGILVSEISATFPLEAIRDAVDAVGTPGRRGKVLFQISPEA